MKTMLPWFLQDRGVLSTNMFFARKLLFIIIITAVILNFLIIFMTFNRMGNLDKKITAHSGLNRKEFDIMRDVLLKTAGDLNQTRSMLNLPIRNYDFESTDAVKVNTDNSLEMQESREALHFYQGFESLAAHYTNINSSRKLNNFLSSSIVQAVLKDFSLEAKMNNNSADLMHRSYKAYTISSFTENQNLLIRITPYYQNNYKIVNEETFSEYISETYNNTRNRIEYNLSEISSLKNIKNSSALKRILSSFNLYIDEPSDKAAAGGILNIYDLKRETGEQIASIRFNKKSGESLINNIIYESSADLIKNLETLDKIIDLRTASEIKIEKVFRQIKEISDDPSFTGFLKDRGYRLEPVPREGIDYYYFDIISVSGNEKLGSYAVNKHTGELFLIDFENVPVSLISLVDNIKKKI